MGDWVLSDRRDVGDLDALKRDGSDYMRWTCL
jgi:hypothetical protein